MRKELLILLVKGCDPSYEAMDHYLIASSGKYNGSYGNWTWDSECLEQRESVELEIMLYIMGVDI